LYVFSILHEVTENNSPEMLQKIYANYLSQKFTFNLRMQKIGTGLSGTECPLILCLLASTEEPRLWLLLVRCTDVQKKSSGRAVKPQ
jgi:hypothetical protein